MKQKRLNIYRIATYIFFVVMVVGAWGSYNYINYLRVEHAKEMEIKENVNMIKETVNDINKIQTRLSIEQNEIINEIVSNAPPAASAERTIPENNHTHYRERRPIYDPEEGINRINELQDKIDRLEAEKIQFEQDKYDISKQIQNVFTVFKLNASNPLINVIFLPLVGYFLKKLIDFGFARIEEKYHVHNGHADAA